MHDSKQFVRHLAYKLEVSAVTVISRLKKLEAKNIIQGYTVRLNHELLGYDITAIIEITTTKEKCKRLKRKFKS